MKILKIKAAVLDSRVSFGSVNALLALRDLKHCLIFWHEVAGTKLLIDLIQNKFD